MRMLEVIKNYIKNKKIIDEYCAFNKKLFKDSFIKKGGREILVEFNAFQPNQIGSSIVSNILAKKFAAKISGYSGNTLRVTPIKYSMVKSLKWTLGNFFNLKTFKLYRSFNTKKIFKPEINLDIIKKSKMIFNSVWPKIKKKK